MNALNGQRAASRRLPMLRALPLAVALACSSGSAPRTGDTGGPPAQTPFTIAITIQGSGAVKSSPAGIDCGRACSSTFPAGTKVALVAQAETGWSFAGWSGACTGAGDCTASATATIAAEFRPTPPPPPAKRSLTVTVQGHGKVTSLPAGIDCGTVCSAGFDDRAQVQLTAQPDTGWSFAGWGGSCASSTATCSLTLTSDHAVTAAFTAIKPADECDGLMPGALPAPVVASLPQNSCLDGTSDDGTGNFLLGYTAGSITSFPNYLFFTIQDGKAVQIGDFVPGGDESATYVHSQPSGFTSFELTGLRGASELLNYSHEGKRTSVTPVTGGDFPPNTPSAAAGVDPSGGMAVVRHTHSAAGWKGTYQRFDKTGVAETPEVTIDNTVREVSNVGVALSGHALVIGRQPSGAWQGRWLARDGAALTDWFALDGPAEPNRAAALWFLLDGGVAVGFSPYRVNDQAPGVTWRFAVRDAKAVAEPLPAWLQARASNSYAAVRGGRAYASWGPPGQCAAGDVEVLSTAGKSCGCVNAPHGSGLNIGRDGSLIVANPPSNFGTCRFDLFPQVFK